MIADLIVIAIIGFSAYLGYKKGFVRSISRLCCFAVSIFAAKLLYSKVAEFVNESFIGDMIREKVAEGYSGHIGDNPPSFIQKAGDYTANGISEMAVSVITIIAIIVITYFIAKIVAASLNLFSKMPVISFFNRTAGLIIGALIGLFIAYAAVSLIIFSDIEGTEKWMENSVIAYTMYSENILLDLIF